MNHDTSLALVKSPRPQHDEHQEALVINAQTLMSWMGLTHTECSLIRDNLMRDDDEELENRLAGVGKKKRNDIANNARRVLRSLRGEDDDEEEEEEEEEEYLTPREATPPPPPEDPSIARRRAAMEMAAFMRNTRYRSGKLLVSYLDGTSHEGPVLLREHNKIVLYRLMNEFNGGSVPLPDEKEFDLSELEAFARDRELCELGMNSPDAPESVKIKRRVFAELREDYNTRAKAMSRKLLYYEAVRLASLPAGQSPRRSRSQPTEQKLTEAQEEAQRAEEEAKNAEEEVKRAQQLVQQAEAEKKQAEEDAKKALEQAQAAAMKAQEAHARAEEKARKAEGLANGHTNTTQPETTNNIEQVANSTQPPPAEITQEEEL